jgi:hypothetical protein
VEVVVLSSNVGDVLPPPPTTSRFALGLVVPIPTLLDVSILILFALAPALLPILNTAFSELI